LLFAPFSPYFEAASCAGQSPHELLALRGPATIHWMVAAYEGLPYQTLIASVLHKYAAGHLAL